MNWSKTKAESRIPSQDAATRPCRIGWTGLVFVFLLLTPSSLFAAPLAFIESFPQLADPSALIHLIDGNENTQWCTTSATASTRVRFHFNTPQAIHHARVILSEAPRKPLAIKLSSESLILAVAMENRKLRVELAKPLEGSYLDIIIPSQPESVCLAGIELSSNQEKLTQIDVSPELLKARLALAGTWKSGPLGAPNRAWTFSLDGTWSWHHTEPFLARSESLRGMWTLSHNQLILTVPNRKAPIRLSLARQAVQIDEWAEDAPDGDYEQLDINAATKLGIPLIGRYNNARFEMLE